MPNQKMSLLGIFMCICGSAVATTNINWPIFFGDTINKKQTSFEDAVVDQRTVASDDLHFLVTGWTAAL